MPKSRIISFLAALGALLSMWRHNHLFEQYARTGAASATLRQPVALNNHGIVTYVSMEQSHQLSFWFFGFAVCGIVAVVIFAAERWLSGREANRA